VKRSNLWMLIGYVPIPIWVVIIVVLKIIVYAGENCVVNEGYSRGCIVLGMDFNGLAYDLGMLATWGAALFVFPVAIIWTGILFLVLMVRAIKIARK